MYSLSVLLQQWGPHHGPQYGPMGGAGGFGGGLHWGPWWVLLALIILIGAVYLVGQLRREQAAPDGVGTQDEALAVLRQRYATGDIDDEEFEERRRMLSATRHS